MQEMTIALDWTINTNHSPIIAARELGYYREAGIDLQILHPGMDAYQLTPAKKIELGLADIAICPTESLISFRMKASPFSIAAIGCLFHSDLSSIVTLQSSGLDRPALLAGQRYASYHARYEDAIVQQLIAADGGNAAIDIIYPPKLGIWDTLLNGTAAATWIFDNWEGVMARHKGVALHHFRLGDYGIPYGYSPVLAASTKQVQAQPSLFDAFIRATIRGVAYCAAAPAAVADLLLPLVPAEVRDLDFIRKSQLYTNPFYATDLRPQTVTAQAFLNWLNETGLETTPLNWSDFYLPVDQFAASAT